MERSDGVVDRLIMRGGSYKIFCTVGSSQSFTCSTLPKHASGRSWDKVNVHLCSDCYFEIGSSWTSALYWYDIRRGSLPILKREKIHHPHWVDRTGKLA